MVADVAWWDYKWNMMYFFGVVALAQAQAQNMVRRLATEDMQEKPHGVDAHRSIGLQASNEPALVEFEGQGESLKDQRLEWREDKVMEE